MPSVWNPGGKGGWCYEKDFCKGAADERPGMWCRSGERRSCIC